MAVVAPVSWKLVSMKCLVIFQEHALLNRIESCTSEAERKKLAEISAKQKYVATLLPIRTVGVQVNTNLVTLKLMRARKHPCIAYVGYN